MSQRIDQHEAIARLLKLSEDLQRTPKWNEIKTVVSTDVIYRLFGSIPEFISAAGLEPVEKNRRIDNSIFEAKDCFIKGRLVNEWEMGIA